jgi:hypothetical protein
MEEITVKDKLKCVQRELALRRNVYAQRVARGNMTLANARREIALMQAIEKDYELLLCATPADTE